MYKIGDKILYPMHGAGVIEEIEEQTVLGKKQAYYIMKMPPEGMKVMIPTATCEDIGVRFIISQTEGLKVLERFRSEPISNDDNWNRRHRENMVKIKSGDIYQVLTVVKNLMFRDRRKGLSTSERKMLGVSRQILVSELVLCGAADKSDVESIMSDTIEELL
ncbi:MAG: CarD family transcriptional regulator [Clostridia bacterium]|nr:CarD family transcriptional regulator [Clostridia bacterium]